MKEPKRRDRVLLVHAIYSQRGGEETVLSAEAELLRRNGHDVEVFTVLNEEMEEMSPFEQAKTTIWNQAARRQIETTLKSMAPDVVHVHNTFPLLSPGVFGAARKAGAAVVQTLHNYRRICIAATLHREGAPCRLCVGKAIPWPGVRHGCYRASVPASVVATTMELTHRALGTYRRNIDRFIVLSEFAKTMFVAGGLAEGRLSVKRNFLPVDPGAGSGSGGYAVYAGRLSEDKGVLDAVEAWRQVGSGITLRVIGDGPLRSQIGLYGETIPGVQVLGAMTHEHVLDQLRGARFMVFPSHLYEGSPMAIIEALAVGTPVIAADIGAASEMIEDGVTGRLYPVGNSDKLAAQVRELLAADGRTQTMRVNARSAYQELYSAGVNYVQLMAIYAAARAESTRAPA